MNDSKLVLNFIKSLTEKTLKNQIAWEYLDDDSNEELAYNLNLSTTSPSPREYVHNFNTDESFCSFHNEQNISMVLLKDLEDNLHLIIAPFTYKNILTISDIEYVAPLTELLNAVKKQFPNPFDFMENFLKD